MKPPDDDDDDAVDDAAGPLDADGFAPPSPSSPTNTTLAPQPAPMAQAVDNMRREIARARLGH